MEQKCEREPQTRSERDNLRDEEHSKREFKFTQCVNAEPFCNLPLPTPISPKVTRIPCWGIIYEDVMEKPTAQIL